MGIKSEYAINIFGSSQNSSSLTANRVDDWDYFQKSGVKEKYQKAGLLEKKFRDSMDRMLDKHNIDTIKKTMQMHEDTFKHQIRELHRLYSVQKMLMEELKREIKLQKRHWGGMTSTSISTAADHHMNLHSQLINWQQHSPTQTSNSEYNFHLQRLRDDNIPVTRERRGSCSGETLRMSMSRGFDLERPAELEDMATGVSTIDHQELQARPSSHHHMSFKTGCDEDSEVELTLSIGSSKNKKRPKSFHLPPHQLMMIQKPREGIDSPASLKSSDRGGGGGGGGDCNSDPTAPMSSSSSATATLCDQERKQPHWLFHGLKLK